MGIILLQAFSWSRWAKKTLSLPCPGGTQQSFIQEGGGLHPEIQPFTLLYTIFAMRMFVEKEVGDLVERTPPSFDEVLSGIKHSIPVFVLMPDHSSVSTPLKISPVESIRRIAEVKEH